MAKLIVISEEDFEKVKETVNVNLEIDVKDGITKKDIIDCRDYIAVKTFERKEIEEIINETEFLPSTKNIDAVINTGLLDELNQKLYVEEEIIKEAVVAAIKDGLIRKPEHIDDLVMEDEELKEIILNDNIYCPRKIIIEKGTTDLGSCIEKTLHKMLDVGLSDEIIMEDLGAEKLSDEDYENESAYVIDLGYGFKEGIYNILTK